MAVASNLNCDNLLEVSRLSHRSHINAHTIHILGTLWLKCLTFKKCLICIAFEWRLFGYSTNFPTTSEPVKLDSLFTHRGWGSMSAKFLDQISTTWRCAPTFQSARMFIFYRYFNFLHLRFLGAGGGIPDLQIGVSLHAPSSASHLQPSCVIAQICKSPSRPLRSFRPSCHFASCCGRNVSKDFTPTYSLFPKLKGTSVSSWISKLRMPSFKLRNSSWNILGMSLPPFTREAFWHLWTSKSCTHIFLSFQGISICSALWSLYTTCSLRCLQF